jgi:hypothetical protein
MGGASKEFLPSPNFWKQKMKKEGNMPSVNIKH